MQFRFQGVLRESETPIDTQKVMDQKLKINAK